MASRFSVRTGRKPVPRNVLYVRGSWKFISASTDTFMNVYRAVMSPKVRVGLFLFRFLIRYALDSSVPSRVAVTSIRFMAIDLGVNDSGLFPNLFIRPASMRMNIWKTATSRAIRVIRLFVHERIFSRPPAMYSVVRARVAQQIEGTKYAINPPGRSTFRITDTAKSRINIMMGLRDMFSYFSTIFRFILFRVFKIR